MKKLRLNNRNIKRIVVKMAEISALKGQLRRKMTKLKHV